MTKKIIPIEGHPVKHWRKLIKDAGLIGTNFNEKKDAKGKEKVKWMKY